MKSKRSKACDISQKVKKIVWERDNYCCIICGNPYAMPNSHYITRAQGGLGIKENIVTMCLDCHNAYDNGNDTDRKKDIKNKIEKHLSSLYKDWNKENLIYRKWRN